jgi:Skp family chaperone for outer membrane proteins
MNVRSLLSVGLTASLLLTALPAVSAPPAASGPAPAPLTQGPPIPGMCVISFNEIIGASKVGQAVVARLKVLGSQVNAELQPEADGIRTDGKALEAQQATLDAATLQARKANLDLRVANFEKREQLRQQEMQATQQKQFGVVAREVDPILRTLYQQQRCSMLIDADNGGVRLLNPTMDLSSAIVSQLDVKITTLTFDREHLDTQAPPAGR